MWTNYVFTKIMGGGHFINIPNEMLHSKRAIMILSGDWSKPNQPRPTFMKKCKQPKHKYSMPLQATLHLFTCSCRKNTCLAMTKLHFIVFIVYENATKKYTHQSLTCCFIEWLAQPPNIHFGLQHWIFQFSPDSIYVLDYSCPHASNLFVLLTFLAK